MFIEIFCRKGQRLLKNVLCHDQNTIVLYFLRIALEKNKQILKMFI